VKLVAQKALNQQDLVIGKEKGEYLISEITFDLQILQNGKANTIGVALV
jgi:hypothetical protein